MATANLANLRHTSFLIEEQVPAFVRSDHPQFILFLEQYYKHIQSANTGVYDSVSNTYFMGPTHFTKSALEYLDVDTTDFDRFLSSFKAEFAPSLPKQLDSITDKASFYKNILEFYKTKGTEDSFKVLFRLLYGEEIELYYPNRDILTLSGGTFAPEVRIRLAATNNLEDIVGRRIYGANSGVYATVERIARNYDAIKYPWRDPTDRDDSIVFAYLDKLSISNTTTTQTEFDIGEIIYTGNVSGNHVNTMILASPTKTVFFDDFSTYANVNYLLALSDNRGSLTNSLSRNTADPLYVGGEFDESVNVFSTNTGNYDNRWFDWRSMLSTNLSSSGLSDQYVNPGITFVSDESASGETIMVIGNEGNTHGITSITSNQNTEDLVELIHTTNIKIDSSKLYKFSVKVKDPYHYVNTATRSSDSGGPRTVAGPYFNSGYSALKSDGLTFNDQLGSSYTAGEHWILSSHLPSGVMNYESANNGIGVDYGSDTQQANSWTHDWRIFQAYVTGSNAIADTAGFGNSREHSNATASPVQNVFSYIYSPAAFHSDTSYIRPLIQVEQALGDNANTGGSQFYVDYYKIEEMGTIEPLVDVPHYFDETSRLSTKSAVIQDNAYYQQYAYDIRSKQNFQDYTSVVEKAVHPAGFKRYGTRLSNSVISSSSIVSESSLTSGETFSPSSIDSLAGWWKADAIEPTNIYQYQRWSSNVTSNGAFGTNTNRLPVGISSFEEGFDYTLTFLEDSIVSNVVYDSTAPIGENVLKLTDKHSSSAPDVWISANDDPLVANTTYNTDVFSIVLDHKKEWLFSAWVKTNNITVQDSQEFNTIRVALSLANTQGYNVTTFYAVTQNVSAVDTWERVSARIDASSYWNTRAILDIGFPDRTDFGLSTGNTEVRIDGLMLEEYDSSIHQAAAPYTPSAYVRPGLNGADVVSWYDHSLNEHHVYANTHGDIFHYPQYIANSINGMPAIRFRCDNANDTYFDSGVYPWSSINGGTKSFAETIYRESLQGVGSDPDNDPTHKANATAIFQATTMLANPALSRPISNAWSIIAVGKSTMDYVQLHQWPYNSLTHGGEQYSPTIFASGYFGYSPGSPGGSSIQNPSLIGTGGGEARLVLQVGALSTVLADSHTAVGDPNNPHNITLQHWGVKMLSNIVGEDGIKANSIQTGAGHINQSSNVFQIWGFTEFAGEGLDDSLSFHNNGIRIGNNDTASLGSGSGWNYNPTTVYDGITWSAQQPYVTSIGGWAPPNNQIIDTGTGGINEKWLYGEHNWDGDIAEVLVFNEKLSNVQMALVEGYLAHKYGFQDDLIHKEGTPTSPSPGGLDHPYRYSPPPAIGANNDPDYIDY